MRIPKDIPLKTWIRKLIAQDKIELFYFTEDWRELREEVQRSFHYECQECLKRGRYTKADCVHHVNEVRNRPDLALSRYYVDSKGKQQYNLIPLCNACHNDAHPEKGWSKKENDRFTTEERW